MEINKVHLSTSSTDHQRTKAFAIDRLASSETHCTKRPSMVPAYAQSVPAQNFQTPSLTLHRNNILPSRRRACELNRRLDCLGAGIPKEKGVQQTMWHNRPKTLDQSESRRVKSNATL